MIATNTVSEPPDFDAFWTTVRHELAASDLDAEITPVRLRDLPEASVHEASFTSLGGIRLSCWYVVPRNKPGPFPTLINFPGYQGEPRLIREWAQAGVISLSVGYRGKFRSQRQFDPGFPGFLTHGIQSAGTFSYRGVYADVRRAVEFLLTRPEVDRERMLAHGVSGGGGLAIVAMAMCPELKAGVAGCPFMCSIGDAIAAVRTYPYNEIVCYLRAHPEQRAQVLQTLSYFDAVNFARRVERPMAVQIGMEDDVCPPSTGLAAYQALRGEKHVWLAEAAGHGPFPGYAEWEAGHLRRWLALDANA